MEIELFRAMLTAKVALGDKIYDNPKLFGAWLSDLTYGEFSGKRNLLVRLLNEGLPKRMNDGNFRREHFEHEVSYRQKKDGLRRDFLVELLKSWWIVVDVEDEVANTILKDTSKLKLFLRLINNKRKNVFEYSEDVTLKNIFISETNVVQSGSDFFNLGEKYFNGREVKQDYTEAVKWYRKSADQGNSWGQNNLGYMYLHGLGVKQDCTEALNWYRKSADQGNETAQCNLGWMYENGLGVEQDYTEALNWYRKSANKGNETAQCNLGWMYENGLGVKQNYRWAEMWYRKSADQGNNTAQKKMLYIPYFLDFSDSIF